MKTINELEKEAKQARENLIATIELGAPASLLADDMILAAVAMVTYQFALAAQETDTEPVRNILRPPRIDIPSAMIGPYSNAPEVAVWNPPPEVMAGIKEYFEKQKISGDGSGKSLPEVSQEARDSDGWSDWNGGKCPVGYSTIVDVKTKIGDVFERYVADKFHWEHHGSEGDIVAYRLAK